MDLPKYRGSSALSGSTINKQCDRPTHGVAPWSGIRSRSGSFAWDFRPGEPGGTGLNLGGRGIAGVGRGIGGLQAEAQNRLGALGGNMAGATQP